MKAKKGGKIKEREENKKHEKGKEREEIEEWKENKEKEGNKDKNNFLHNVCKSVPPPTFVVELILSLRQLCHF